jgi:heterodisulfide reductase subunit C
MAEGSSDKEGPAAARIALDVWWRHAEQQVDRDYWASFCQDCGACVADCPAAKFGLNFDPRVIVLKLRYGLADELLGEHSILWQCFQCARCGETCAQPVKPVEMIGRLRRILADLFYGEQSGTAEAQDNPADSDPQAV